MTIELPAETHRLLSEYAEAMKAQTGQAVEPAKLVAPMLARFMVTDREFIRGRKRS